MEMDKNRRDFLVKAGLTGFAAAVYPLSGFTLTTNSDGIKTEDVLISTKDIKMEGYQAYPAKGKNFPVIIVVHEIFGVHEHIRDVCRRFAKQGFLAIAPNLFQRQGDVTKIKEIPDIIKIVGQASTEQVMQDCDATVDFVKKNKKADVNKLNITGFCWGGRTTWLYSAYNPNVKAGVAWYGPLVGTDDLHPKAPIDIVSELKTPVLGLYGALDTHITAEHVQKMKKALELNHSTSKIVVFDKAEHGFFADYRPSYNAEAASQGFKICLDWIKQHGDSA